LVTPTLPQSPPPPPPPPPPSPCNYPHATTHPPMLYILFYVSHPVLSCFVVADDMCGRLTVIIAFTVHRAVELHCVSPFLQFPHSHVRVTSHRPAVCHPRDPFNLPARLLTTPRAPGVSRLNHSTSLSLSLSLSRSASRLYLVSLSPSPPLYFMPPLFLWEILIKVFSLRKKRSRK